MVQLVVNGTKVETQADPGMPPVWFLRDQCRRNRAAPIYIRTAFGSSAAR